MLAPGIKPGDDYRGLDVTASAAYGTWTDADARITVAKVHSGSRLVLIFYVPNQTPTLKHWFQNHPLGLSVAIDHAAPQARCCFRGGIANAEFALPPKLWKERGEVTFTLHVQGAVVLHAIDPTQADRRRLGIVLVRLFFY